MEKAERIQAIERIINKITYREEVDINSRTITQYHVLDNLNELATAIEEAIGVDESKIEDFLIKANEQKRETQADGIRVMETAKAISTNKEVIKICPK